MSLRSPVLPTEQGFPQGAQLIRQAENHRLPASGQPGQVQRPHMAIDHLPFLGIELEKAVRILQGPVCVVEAMPLVISILVVPIIEIQVVQEGPPHQGGLIRPQVKATVEPKAHPGHIGTVSIGSDAAMLDISLHLPSLGGVGGARQQPVEGSALLPGQSDHVVPLSCHHGLVNLNGIATNFFIVS